MKDQKGITLIALVITIIVLLILAGVTIAMLSGDNGILTNANNSKTETLKGEAIERINLALNDIKTEIYAQQATDSTWSPLGTDGKNLKTEMASILTNDGFESGSASDDKYVYSVDENGILTLSYKNAAQKIDTEITGTINLKTSPYKITPATK